MLEYRRMTRKQATRKRAARKPGPRARIVKPREPDKTGPDTSRLVIEGGDYEEAIRKALGKPTRPR